MYWCDCEACGDFQEVCYHSSSPRSWSWDPATLIPTVFHLLLHCYCQLNNFFLLNHL
ncbi:hypothetical protein HanXRQr2_Chr03g0090801 [Helianthus annuus]|uniref:Uncharacterized protein n=1 Tax=Helianthus annuus TaxID=4232 RepID=A0A251V3Y4_HELAN|nr:hypothetical protein HanXRQr2_Chr03g0090801 [Helianthus annuus]